MSAEAMALLARTWICVRGPSPPEAPVEDWVRRSLVSAFTCRMVSFVSFWAKVLGMQVS